MDVSAITIEAELKRCLRSPYLAQDAGKKALVPEELAAARDLYQKAEQSFQAADEATGLKQVWGAMFRAARALVYAAGYEVDGLRCLEVVIEAHYVGRGIERADIAELRRAQELAGPGGAALERAQTFMQKVAGLV